MKVGDLVRFRGAYRKIALHQIIRIYRSDEHRAPRIEIMCLFRGKRTINVRPSRLEVIL